MKILINLICPECHTKHIHFNAVRRCLISIHDMAIISLILGSPKAKKYKIRHEKMKKYAKNFLYQQQKALSWKKTSEHLYTLSTQVLKDWQKGFKKDLKNKTPKSKEQRASISLYLKTIKEVLLSRG